MDHVSMVGNHASNILKKGRCRNEETGRKDFSDLQLEYLEGFERKYVSRKT